MSLVYSTFTTRRDGMLFTRGVVVDCRAGGGEISPVQFAALARAAHGPDAAAYGKIAFLRADGIAVYQSDPLRGVAPTFCGNATAAALAFATSHGDARTTVRCAERTHDVCAQIHGSTVMQTWLVTATEAEERTWRGLRVITVAALNPYALVLGTLPDGTNAEAARQELLGPGLATKLAVIEDTDKVPLVVFYNGNGRHGAAPHTGLATIALAMRSVPWFAALFPITRVRYHTASGTAERDLPAISPTPDSRLAIPMPPVDVDICQVAVGAAA